MWMIVEFRSVERKTKAHGKVELSWRTSTRKDRGLHPEPPTYMNIIHKFFITAQPYGDTN